MANPDILLRAYRLMCTATAMAETYENNRSVCKYVHSVSRGHEAVQIAAAFHLLPVDFVSPYYRDESLLLALGFTPYQLMMQLLAKAGDIFSGGREYYAHPSSRAEDKPRIIHQSSATGMQAIPATGLAQGMALLETARPFSLPHATAGPAPLVLCSLGDASMTEGEISEALQVAVLKKLPIIYLIQDNGWGISATSTETRMMDAFEFASGFKGLGRLRIDGTNFEESYEALQSVFEFVRLNRSPYLIQAKVPLLGHHTSGVRKEAYRTKEDLENHAIDDPRPKLRSVLLGQGVPEENLLEMERYAAAEVNQQFEEAKKAPEPIAETVEDFVFAPAAGILEKGIRAPVDGKQVTLAEAALFAIREIMEEFPEAVLYGQDVGRRLGGVFRETATLAEQFGDQRVFNTAIQEAYIIGSTAGMSAIGLKPIVEIQFADYLYPGFNQLVTELSKSCYLSCGKYPVQVLIRIPVGAYGGGGPYHSGSIETTLLSVKGIKVVFPSNAADMKGLMKAAFLDPNPVVMLEHKGLYWCKVPGTEQSKTPEPSRDYILPLAKAATVLQADPKKISAGDSCVVVTYGMGVYWALAAATRFPGQIEVIDLRTLFPLDEEFVYRSVRNHGKCLVLTEEQQNNSFAEAFGGRISKHCFSSLDAPVEVLGALNLPGVPMNIILEKAMLPGPEKLYQKLLLLLSY
jgi:2-oxoisovalerate dehydrogenase E1 component